MTLQLRDIQELKLQQIAERIAAGERDIVVQLPTGTGKTITAIAFLMRNLTYPGRALIVGHYTELLEQWYSELDKFMDPRFSIGFVQGSRNEINRHIVIGTSQTLSKIDRFKEMYRYGNFDYLIYDEAHRSMSASGKRIVHWAKASPKTVVIRLTATPKRTDGVMTDGSRLPAVPLAVPQELGYLVKEFVTKIYVDAVINEDDLIGGSGEYKTGNKILDTPAINQRIFDEWAKFNRQDKTVVFVSSILHAARLRLLFLQNGVTAVMVSSKHTAGENKEALSRFKSGQAQVLVNVNKVTEGFDVPDIRCLILARPTKSKLVINQIVGRVLRKADGKVYGKVLHIIPRGGDVVYVEDAIKSPY